MECNKLHNYECHLRNLYAIIKASIKIIVEAGYFCFPTVKVEHVKVPTRWFSKQ